MPLTADSHSEPGGRASKRRLRATWSGTWLAALTAFGCGEADAPGDGATNSPGGAGPGLSNARWTIVEEMRVGAGGGPEQFGELKGLAVLADGRFAVLESQARELRVFDPRGGHVATYGRRGEGPGESEFPNGLMLGRRGLLWVPDPSNVRMSLFDPDVGFVGQFQYGTNLTQWAWSGAMGADGRVFGPGLVPETRADLLIVYDSTMAVLDTLPLEEPSEESGDGTNPGSYCWSPSEGVTNCTGVPFYAVTVRFVDPEGYVWERESGVVDYRIRKWAPGGDTVLVVTGDHRPTPVASAERDAEIARLRKDAGDLDWSRIPSVKPVVQDLFMSDEGNLWVKFLSPGDAAAFDVWSPDGAYLGAAVTNIRVHTREVAPVVRGDQMWFVTTDEFDTEHVVRARLSETGGP